MTTAILAGLIVWLITTVIVESEITRPIRQAVYRRSGLGVADHYREETFKALFAHDQKRLHEILDFLTPGPRWHHRLFDKVSYLLTCHLCTGIWVGLGVAAFITGPFDHVIWDGLAYKAVGHLVLGVSNVLRALADIRIEAETVEHHHHEPFGHGEPIQRVETIEDLFGRPSSGPVTEMTSDEPSPR